MASETTPTRAADTARLTELVAVVQRTQRTEDVDGFLDLFAPDAVWVNGAGHRLVGLEEIAAFTRESLPGGMVGQSVRYDVANVRFLASEVAVTSVDQEYLTADGDPFDPRREGKPTYVWARPDVAVAHKRAWSREEAAERGDAPEMIALYVFARRGGRWWIIRRQNTLVPAA